jgi:hypothetical protein
MAHPHIDKSVMGRDIIDAIRSGLALCEAGKIIDIDGGRCPLGMPFTSAVPEVAEVEIK